MLSSQLNLTNSLQTLQRTHFGINELLGLDSSTTQNLLAQQQQRIATHQLGSSTPAENSSYAQLATQQSCAQTTTQTPEQLFDSFSSPTFAGPGSYLSAANRLHQSNGASQYLASGLYGKSGAGLPIFSSNVATQPCKSTSVTLSHEMVFFKTKFA